MSIGRTVNFLLILETCGGTAAQKSLVWSSKEWAGSEDASFLEYYEHNVENLAVEGVGQNWSSEVISLFLEDLEVGRAALNCHWSIGPAVPRNEGCVYGELRVAVFSSITVFRVPEKFSCGTAAKPFSHRERAVVRNRRGPGAREFGSALSELTMDHYHHEVLRDQFMELFLFGERRPWRHERC